MSISFLFVFSNVSVCSAHLIISFHRSSDLLTTTTSRDRLFSPLVANQTVVHLRRRSILCNSPLPSIVLQSLIEIILANQRAALPFAGRYFPRHITSSRRSYVLNSLNLIGPRPNR